MPPKGMLDKMDDEVEATKTRRNSLSVRLSAKVKSDLLGRFRAGDRLPSERRLALDYDVSPVTIARVLQNLSGEGVVYRVPNRGTYLAQSAIAHVGTQRSAERASSASAFAGSTASGRAEVAAQTIILGDLRRILPSSVQRRVVSAHEIMSSAERHIQKTGGATFVADIGDLDAETWKRRVMEMVSRGANSMIILDEALTAEQVGEIVILQDALPHGFPLVAAAASVIYNVFASVQIDAVTGVRASVKHLVDLGHRRIAFIGPRQNDVEWVGERIAGFLIAARAYGIRATEADVIYPAAEIGFSDTPTRPGYACGFSAATRMLKEASHTAVVAANDFTAIGVMDAATSAGVRVPEDLSVVGYDDVEESGIRSLTTVHRPASAVGAEAAAHIIRRLAAPQSEVRHVGFVAPMIIVRASTRRLDAASIDAP